ncbi:ABC transporter substrate-binding protein [Thorsellia anophelis]|nr:ABC transporter substrate-binding protein [Thorsellia anophelis]
MKLSSLALCLFGMQIAAHANTLVYCSEASPEGFNPQLYTSGTTNDATAVPMYDTLVQFKYGTTELEPGLAERWDVSEDGKRYTFHLRKGVKYHQTDDFTPTREFNADDVLFTYLRQKDTNHPFHKVSGGTYEYFQGMGMGEIISEINKIDDHTVEFILSRSEAPFLANMAMDYASVLSAEYADLMMQAGTPEWVDLRPVGTGPFQLAEYQQDSTIIYDAFEDHWAGPSKIETLIYSITPDAAIRYAKMQKDECQMMPYPNPSDIAMIQKDPNIIVQEAPGLNIGYLSFNVTKPPLDDLRVRKALTYAVNKAAIIDAVYQGAGQSAKNLIPPTMWGYNDDIVDHPYDVEKAKALLAEAGLADSINIDLWAMPVQRPYNPNARRMAEMIQADWAKIGVKANIVSYEWGEYLKRAKDGEHDVVMMGWTGDNGDPDNFFATLFSCQAAQDGSNYSRWCYEPFENIILPARTEINHEKRIELYKQAQVIMHEQIPAMMIANSTVFDPVSKRVSGYKISPRGKHDFYPASIESK